MVKSKEAASVLAEPEDEDETLITAGMDGEIYIESQIDGTTMLIVRREDTHMVTSSLKGLRIPKKSYAFRAEKPVSSTSWVKSSGSIAVKVWASTTSISR